MEGRAWSRRVGYIYIYIYNIYIILLDSRGLAEAEGRVSPRGAGLLSPSKPLAATAYVCGPAYAASANGGPPARRAGAGSPTTGRAGAAAQPPGDPGEASQSLRWHHPLQAPT